jgi:hypothetical protein
MSATCLGDEVQRMALVWLAIGLVGADAAFLPAAQHAAVLAIGLLGGAFAGQILPRRIMVAAETLRAALVLLPLAAWALGLVSLPVLVATAIALAALRALFDPAMQTIVPVVAPDPLRLRGLNGLLDVTTRTARLAGPALAGALGAVLPVIHLLWLPAAVSLASAAVIASLGPRLDPPARTGQTTAWSRAMQGWAILRQDRLIRALVLANAVMLAPWSLTLSVGLPLLVTERGLGLPALAVAMGCYGAGDVLGNILASARIPRRPILQMFAGYLWMGSFLVAMALAPTLPLMAAAALLAGLGGPFFFLQFLATVQSRLRGADLTALLRLRLAIVAGAMMLGAAIGPLPFHALGAAATVMLCGTLIASVGAWGMLRARGWSTP